jgi:two-component system CheB/CheR fusion protein
MIDDNSGNKTKDLVVVGSSAGGIGALSTLVGTLTKNFPAPLVLAQHLDPQRPSHLGSILERRTKLPIVVVSEDSETHLEPGTIYVVPANRHVKISDGHVHLEADRFDRPKPSVDLLLSSAANSYGEHLIAVILTGSGSDGASGAVDVKGKRRRGDYSKPTDSTLSIDAAFVAADGRRSCRGDRTDRTIALRHS